MHTNHSSNIGRFNPSYKVGLSLRQVKQRKKQKLTNKNRKIFDKSNIEILLSNVFNTYNLTLVIVTTTMLILGSFFGLYFALMFLLNYLIGLIIDLKARRELNKLNTQRKTKVIRNETVFEIKESEVVLDDILFLERDDGICVDGTIVQGKATIKEGYITGNSNVVYKNEGDQVLAGSYVADGSFYVRADKVGEDTSTHMQAFKAKMITRVPAKLMHAFRILYRVVSIVSLVFVGVLLLVFYLQGHLNTLEALKEYLLKIMNILMMFIPGAIYLLSTLALAVFVGKLANKNIIIQDLYRLEVLNGIDILCLDKTGTITDGTMVVKRTIIVNRDLGEEYIAQAMSNVLVATNVYNPTAVALRKVYDLELSSGINAVLPFNSANKYCGATFKGGKTFILGVPDYLPLRNKKAILNRCEEFIKEGNRVLVLGESRDPIIENKFIGELDTIAIIIIKEKIREDVIKSLKLFIEKNIEIKIISGDHPQIASTVAQEAGISNANKYVSLENVSIDKVKELVARYTVFGYASPRQKETIISALQEENKRVAMVGDGVNDVLALKRADCAIVMGSGDEIARNLAPVVLKDNKFSQLPEIMNSGRRVMNNLQRVASLLLTKTLFIFLLTVIYAMVSFISPNIVSNYPFNINQLLPWELLFGGLAALLLCFEPNEEKEKPVFIGKIIKTAIPFAVMLTAVVVIIFALFNFQKNGLINFGIYNQDTAIAMSALAVNLLAGVYLYKICKPWTKYRYILCVNVIALDVLVVGISALITYFGAQTETILQIRFLEVSGPAYMITAFIIVLAAAIYLLVNYLANVIKGETKKHEN